MHRFGKKSPSSTTPTNSQPPPSPMVEHIKKELATFYPRVKDNRALVASSSAIALSIASPLCDPVTGEHGLSEESGWGAAYEAARMAVEIAKESSDMFLPLKAVVGALSVLIKNYDQTAANAEQIKDIEARIKSLSHVLTSPVDDQDSAEKARRVALKMKLTEIVVNLRPLSEQSGLMKFLRNVGRANSMNGFVQQLAYAITDYQTSIQQNIYENTRNIIGAADLELLAKLEPVRDAGYHAGHHDTCLRGTRESVLDRIMRWAKDPQDRHVFWLNGLAGTGKSTIAQTFSEMIARTGTLGASFFCSRDYLDRKELKNIFPTLAYQLACRYPSFRSCITRAIKQDPSVAQNSLISQLRDLIVGPLSSTNVSCVIIVDALDECVDDQPASAILSVLGRCARQLPSIKFFITGRPERRIRTGFRLPLLEPLTQIFLLHEVELSSVDEDIRLYLREKLTSIAKRRSDVNLPDPWPCDKDLGTLAKKSSGLFIFASTLAKFIESEYHEPGERLQLILTPSDSTVHEGRAGVDPLYTQVLMHSFSDVVEDPVFANLRGVLAAVVLAFNPLSRAQISGILGIGTSLITTTLRHLHSVLLIPNEDSKEIRVFHKSFPDFLQDRARCPDSRFFIDPAVHHGDMALGCLALLKKLKPNPCDLPDFVMNRDVVDLPELLEGEVGGALRYACRYWALHVRSSPTTDDYAVRLVASATEVFTENVVPWIEVTSLENQLEGVIHSIHNLLEWISAVDVATSNLQNLAQNCLRFTMHFFHPIQQSARHIYHSALPLSPSSSLLHSMIFQEKTLVKGIYGCPDTWGAVVRSIKGSSGNFICMSTFGHRIAAAFDDGTVGVFDSITGVLRSSLNPEDPVQAIRGSPDGSILFCAHNRPSVTLWDTQTGGLIHTFDLEWDAEHIAISSEGRYLACRLSDGPVKVWEVANKTERAAIGSASIQPCWLEPEERLVVAEERSVRIWDVVSGQVLRTFAMHDPVCGLVYSQKFGQLAIAVTSGIRSTITVVDPRIGVHFTSRGVQQRLTCFAFSQTTQEIVCGTETPGLELFDVSTRSWRHYEYPETPISVSSLRNGIVVNVVGLGIQLLSLDGGYTLSRQPSTTSLTVEAFDNDNIIAIYPNNREHIVLLESTALSQLRTIPTMGAHATPVDHIHILCASLRHRVAISCFEEEGKVYLQKWEFDVELPTWAVEMDEPPVVSGIPPTSSQFVSFHNMSDYRTRVCVWNLENGHLRARLTIKQPWSSRPLGIRFEPQGRIFHTYHDTYRVPFHLDSLLQGEARPSFLPLRESLSELPCTKRYEMDDRGEWVMSGLEKVFWIPTGYIRSDKAGYYWIGSVLVMEGQDGLTTMLAFD